MWWGGGEWWGVTRYHKGGPRTRDTGPYDHMYIYIYICMYVCMYVFNYMYIYIFKYIFMGYKTAMYIYIYITYMG